MCQAGYGWESSEWDMRSLRRLFWTTGIGYSLFALLIFDAGIAMILGLFFDVYDEEWRTPAEVGPQAIWAVQLVGILQFRFVQRPSSKRLGGRAGGRGFGTPGEHVREKDHAGWQSRKCGALACSHPSSCSQ